MVTNAVSHGALSVPQGRVHLGWEIAEAGTPAARLVIRWRESGGPEPGKLRERGYGSELIEKGLHQEIGATGSIAFADGGTTAELTLPLSSGLVQVAEAVAEAIGNK